MINVILGLILGILSRVLLRGIVAVVIACICKLTDFISRLAAALDSSAKTTQTRGRDGR
jgi:hypothetical protein